MDERGAPTVGLLIGALSIALGLVGMPETPGIGLPRAYSIGLVGAGLVVSVAFSARRHDRLDRIAGASIALLASVGVVAIGLAATLGPPGSPWGFGLSVIVTGMAAGALAAADLRQRSAKQIASAVRSLSFAVLIVLGGFLLAGLFLTVPEVLRLDLSPVVHSAFEQIALGLAFVCAAIGFMFATGRGLGYVDLRTPDRRDLQWTIGGIGLIVATAIGIGMLYSLLGIEGAEHEMADRARAQGIAILLVGIPLTLVVTAVGEELLYRNGVQKYLTERFAPVTAILVSSFLFAVAHLPALTAASSLGLMATVSVIFILSLILAIAYERTRNVLVPVLIHGMYNVTVYTIWMLELLAT